MRPIACEVCGEEGWVRNKAPALCPDHADARRREEWDAAWKPLRDAVVGPLVRLADWLEKQLRKARR